MIMKNGQVKRPKKTLEAAIKALSGAKNTKQDSEMFRDYVFALRYATLALLAVKQEEPK